MIAELLETGSVCLLVLQHNTDNNAQDFIQQSHNAQIYVTIEFKRFNAFGGIGADQTFHQSLNGAIEQIDGGQIVTRAERACWWLLNKIKNYICYFSLKWCSPSDYSKSLCFLPVKPAY